MAPVAASSRTPRRRKAQHSYATETKKLAGRRLAAVILQPISDALPPNPMAPTPSLLASSTISVSSFARAASGLTSSRQARPELRTGYSVLRDRTSFVAGLLRDDL